MISNDDMLSIWSLDRVIRKDANGADLTVWDNMVYPESWSEDDQETFRDNLKMELAEFELLYPSWPFMRDAIGSWSRKNKPVWEKLDATLHFEYNPIWNKDGTVTETRQLAGSAANSGTDTTTYGRIDTDVNQVAAFNNTAGAFEDRGKDTNTASGSDSIQHGQRVDTTDSGTITRLEQGNIGITTTQQMITEEREISGFNLMDYMIADFKSRFCLTIY